MKQIFTGKVWCFDDNISTDLIMPGFAALSNPDMTLEESAQYCMYSNRPGWAKQVTAGDLIVGGKNFGCGSSRPASQVIKALGIPVLITESVSRIFFRNSINVGLAVITCPGIRQEIMEGDQLEVDLSTGMIRDLTTGKQFQGSPLPAGSPPMEILESGGIIPYIQQHEGNI